MHRKVDGSIIREHIHFIMCEGMFRSVRALRTTGEIITKKNTLHEKQPFLGETHARMKTTIDKADKSNPNSNGRRKNDVFQDLKHFILITAHKL